MQEITPLAKALARREAHHPDDEDDLVQIGLFAYHRAQSAAPIESPFAHARTVLQRAMWGFYSSTGAKFDEQSFVQLPDESDRLTQASRRYLHIQRGIAVAAFAGLDGQAQDGTQAELLELEDYFAALEQNCGRRARDIAVNLVSPTGECSRRILEEAARKQRIQQRMRGSRNQPRGVQNEIRLSQRTVRLALGLSASEWSREMNQIKTFTRTWLSR